MRPKILLAVAAVLAAASAFAAESTPRATDPALLEKGRAVWNFRCYFCHGYSGDAKTLATSFMERKPRDFQSADPSEFPMARILAATRHGVPGTPMKGFANVIPEAEIQAVAAFLRDEFLEKRARNTRYHTKQAGWPDHDRYLDAYPFAREELPIDADDRALTPSQRRGKKMFLEACITCHDRARVTTSGPTWERVTAR